MAECSAVCKYPRTSHFPFSPGKSEDDIVLHEESLMVNFPLLKKEVVITEKLDGGNCSISGGKVYARTVNGEATHPSFGPIKQLASQIQSIIPSNLQLFGENMYGVHSIEYDGLESFFYLFSALKDGIHWLSWDQIVELADEAGLTVVPEVERGVFTKFKDIEAKITSLMKQSSRCGTCDPEGFVVRTIDGFESGEFDYCMAKYVRSDHIQTDESWRRTWKRAKLNDTSWM